MFFNPSVILLGVAGLTAAIPLPAQEASPVAAPVQVKREVVNQVVQEEVVIYVDVAGNPVSTTTAVGVPATVQTPAAQPPPPADTPTTTSSSSVAAPTATAQTSPPKTNSKIGTASLSGASFSKGVTYTPRFASTSCKNADQVKQDISVLLSQGYDLIRLYGTDCNGPQNLQAALKGTNVWMFLGIFDLGKATAEASDMASQLGNDWSQVHTVAVGNEIVKNGGNPADVVAAIGTVRNQLRGVGYNGPVVTVDAAVVVEKAPELCTKSDYCAVNCHSYWDGNPASEAANTINFHVNALKQVTGMDKVVITEAGWPTCGAPVKASTAGKSAQQQALDSLGTVTVANMIYFSGFNEYWKGDLPGSDGLEKCWGIYGDAPSGA